MSGTIYTLGTGMRSLNEFLKIIKQNRINIVADVRRFPTSRFEEFKKETLNQTCIKEGIDYIYFGNELGGFRSGGYERYTETEEFIKGINELAKIAHSKTICIICAETLPWKCHRRFIAKKLMEMGYEVIHIIDERRTYQQQKTTNLEFIS